MQCDVVLPVGGVHVLLYASDVCVCVCVCVCVRACVRVCVCVCVCFQHVTTTALDS